MVDEAGTTQQAGTVTAEQAMMLLLLSKAELKALEREGAFAPMAPGRYWLKDLVQGFARHVGKRDAPVPVSVAEMARHLDCAPAYIRKLVDQGTIPRRADGKFDLDQCRAAYLKHLREARKVSPRGAADTAFTQAKAELIQLRIDEKRRNTISHEEAMGREDKLVGIFLTSLSSLPAQCAIGDRRVQRRLEQWVRTTRTAIAADMNKLADAEEAEVQNGTHNSAVRAVPANERLGV